MTPQNSQKYNIAWFKLAEFVVRGEKERALGIYRLLSHSIQDNAFSCHLEADLLLSFNDEKAVEAYNRAAFLYQKEGKLQQAAGIYEHLSLLKLEIPEYLSKLVVLYHKLNNDLKKLRSTYALINLFIKLKKIDGIELIFNQTIFNKDEMLMLYQHLIFTMLEHPQSYNQDDFYSYLKRCLDYIKDDVSISKFMAKLSQLDNQAYNYACNYLR